MLTSLQHHGFEIGQSATKAVSGHAFDVVRELHGPVDVVVADRDEEPHACYRRLETPTRPERA
ncbi:hypothetical protein ABZ442_20430 [Streptomyces triculaminicus]|uniref:hypothetical protein n=1 Tax=Streptomyces triculaminicus TaxID=2816232 RepID=UPI0033E62154